MAVKAELVIALVGQTATGKSDLAVRVAEAVDGEVINADAMQLYRGMNVGTAKITSAEMRGIPHHLFDVLDVTEEASVAVYQQQARSRIDEVRARGKTPILVGGSGLYVRAALNHMEFPPTDPQLRSELYARLEREGLAALYQELQDRDPAAAATIEPRNDRRIIRALEVIALTNRPFAASLPTQEYVYPTVQLALQIAQKELDVRIRRRVENMWQAGLVAEVQELLTRGLATAPTASRAVGYAETIRHLNGEFDAQATQDLIAQSTRQLARRQRRWFARDERVNYLPATAPLSDVLSVLRDSRS
ncbi:MAG TPA: tRNA (adenosine(37)-N6)-dimethylallyltransferase MiaA [Actinomycetales bacterium]|nr:tRNA (adenosine(37)-N6)-dimethylallyltransferase MiaA [Actinomycetales bacterium]